MIHHGDRESTLRLGRAAKGGRMSVFHRDEFGVVLLGDALAVLRSLPDASVDCCVTSPPYWGLRDYGVEGQIGNEKTPTEFVAKMVEVFREVRRVLKPTGNLFLNIGDSYSPDGKQGGSGGCKNSTSVAGGYMRTKGNIGLRHKNLIGIPWRVAFALQDDGWILRRDIIWAKPNPMPESVRDRCTSSHEYIFHMTKQERYFYDAEAIREPSTYAGPNSPDSIKSPHGQGFSRNAQDDRGGPNSTFRKNKQPGNCDPKDYSTDKQRGHGRRHDGFNDRWDAMEKAEQCSSGRNKRSVWTIATRPFPGAHFATFPPEIPTTCILCGCPEGGTVLDPFAGSGTTLAVAKSLGRKFVGIELNPEYAKMIVERLSATNPTLDLFGAGAA